MLAESLEDRLWARVEKQFCGCWLWQGGKFTNGYGSISFGRTALYTHRVAYQLLRGEIDPGLQLDHLCRVKNCVNPEHLEPVTQRENVLRGESFAAVNSQKSHCLNGHELAGTNLIPYYLKRNGRQCRVCANTRAKKNRKIPPSSI